MGIGKMDKPIDRQADIGRRCKDRAMKWPEPASVARRELMRGYGKKMIRSMGLSPTRHRMLFVSQIGNNYSAEGESVPREVMRDCPESVPGKCCPKLPQTAHFSRTSDPKCVKKRRVYYKTLIHGSTVNCHNGRHQVTSAIAMHQVVPG
jgi:hypothetical protein